MKKDLKYWTKRINEYTNKTERHLFKDDFWNRHIKLVTFSKDNQNYVCIIKYNNNNERHNVIRIVNCDASSSETLFFLKKSIFPEWIKTKAVKNFKANKENSLEIKNYLEENYDSKTSVNQSVIEGILKRLEINKEILD